MPRAANREGYLKAVSQAHNFSGSLYPSAGYLKMIKANFAKTRPPKKPLYLPSENPVAAGRPVSAKLKTHFRFSGSLIRRQNRV
ncbi:MULTISPECIES: hypothetical protein [unclassified Eikenella]|uniref:hypothetical protein n=1 Tax=unclassified Eikenella TaxID=2639367 RepID=UPI00114C9BEF|nr:MULTISPECIES: hypothetical protein [unclassified Eikenella]